MKELETQRKELQDRLQSLDVKCRSLESSYQQVSQNFLLTSVEIERQIEINRELVKEIESWKLKVRDLSPDANANKDASSAQANEAGG